MRISQAGLKSGLPTTRFTASPSHRREPRLGLHRRLAPQITSHPGANARVPLVDALHSAARGVGGTSAQRPPQSAAARTVLRRADSIRWSQSTDGQGFRPRSRSAAPWRG